MSRINLSDWNPAIDLVSKITGIIDPADSRGFVNLTDGDAIVTWPDSTLRGGLSLDSPGGTVTWNESSSLFNDQPTIDLGTGASYLSSSNGVSIVWWMGVFNYTGSESPAGEFNPDYPTIFCDAATQNIKPVSGNQSGELYTVSGSQQALPNSMMNATDVSAATVSFVPFTTPKAFYKRQTGDLGTGIRLGRSALGWQGEFGWLAFGRTDLTLQDHNLLLAYLNDRFELYTP